MKKYLIMLFIILFVGFTACLSNEKESDGTTGEDTKDIPKPVIDGTNSVVSLVQSSNVANVTRHTYASIKDMVDESIRLAGGLEGIVKQGDTVVLKPNIITTIYGWQWPSGTNIPEGAPDAITPTAPNGIVTDWRVVQAVAENVRTIIGSTGKIFVMESSGKGNTAVQYTNVGYTKANLSAVDEILTLDAIGGSYWTSIPSTPPDDILKVQLSSPEFKTAYTSNGFTSYDGQGNYYVVKKMYEADAFICIPVLKLHTTAGTTGAIKNISIGATPPRIYGNSANDIGRNNRIPHSEASGIHKWIADYYSVMPADFVVMEALQGVDQGPLPPATDSSALKRMNSMLASKDGLAIDVVLSNIIKVDYKKVGHLNYLTARGKVGTKKETTVHGNPKDIIVIGNRTVHDLREDVNFSGSITTGLNGSIDTTRLTAQQLDKPTVTITSAEFESGSLNLDLAVSANTVKADIFIGKTYLSSVKANFNNIVVDASTISSGSYNITVRVYTDYMGYGEATVTAVK